MPYGRLTQDPSYVHLDAPISTYCLHVIVLLADYLFATPENLGMLSMQLFVLHSNNSSAWTFATQTGNNEDFFVF